MPSGARLFVDCLKALGVTHAFSLPGTGIMNLLEAVAETPEIRCLTVRHEQIAAHMADGYARAGGKPGVVMASRGPGAANTLVGITCAYPACSPVVVIAGQTPTQWIGREALEEFDLVAMFRPVTKYAFQALRASTFPEVLRRAFSEAVSGRPGPVLVSVPADLFREEVQVPIPSAPPSIPQRPRPDPDSVSRALALLLEARFPVLLLGGGVNVSGAAGSAAALAERLGLAAVPSSEPDVFPGHHPLFVNDRLAVKEADLVLAVGCRFSELGTFGWTLLPPQARLIHVDIDPFQIDKIHPAAVGLVGDAKAALEDLLAAASAAPLGAGTEKRIEERRERVRERREEFQRRRWPAEGWDSVPITPWRFVRDLQEVLPEDALIVSNASTLGHWLNRCYEFKIPGTLMHSVGGATGFGLPAAAGAKVALPERTVVCLSGDGAFTMVEGTLNTLVHGRIPVFTVVWNNSAFLQTALHTSKVPGNYLHNPDFVSIAVAYGVSARRVEQPGDLREALDWGLRETRNGRPALVEVTATGSLKEATPARYFAAPSSHDPG